MPRPAEAVWRPIVTEIVRERIGAGEPTWLPVRGRSMQPLLAWGTRILVAPAARVRIGDLLVYERDGAIVCHRVLGRHRRTLLTRADQGGAAAERVTGSQILGVVVALERTGVVVDLTARARRMRALAAAARSGAGAASATMRRHWWRRS